MDRLFRLGTIFLFPFLVSCSGKNHQKELEIRQQIKEGKIAEFAFKFNAIINWQDSLQNKYDAYTAQVQEFFSKNNRPIVIQEAYLDDIIVQDGTYFLELDDIDFDHFYRLSCDYRVVEKILADSASYYYSPVAIAQINSVAKGYKYDCEIEPFDEFVAGSLVHERVTILKGECLDTIGEL
jgi:hypothetical protein